MVILYIKIHNKTGLKYFGKTTKKNYEKYLGSGTYWQRHLKVHGNDITTIVYAQFNDNDEKIVDVALDFSIENDIVRSKEWANLKYEDGLDGGTAGFIFSKEQKLKISNTLKEGYRSGMLKPQFGAKGRTLTEVHKTKISNTLKEKYKNEDHPTKGVNNGMYGKTAWNKGIPAWNKGIPLEKVKCDFCCMLLGINHISQCSLNKEHKNNNIDSTSDLIRVCPHCSKSFYNRGRGFGNATRWHFDNCKYSK